MCDVKCKVGVPCEYKDEVDFRIIVMTFDRNYSLSTCLDAISRVDTMGKRLAVDIWIDRSSKTKKISADIVKVATNFQKTWKGGRACVHERETNAYIDGQWIDTWHPKVDTREIALIIEDDVDISNQSLRWLHHAHDAYDHLNDIGGYTLQMQGTRFFAGGKGGLRGPPTDNVFLYGVLGTWGYSPHANSWREFQHFFHSKNSSVKPYVPGILPNKWYQMFEKTGRQRSMWEMWHIYFTRQHHHFTVYCNIHVMTGRGNILLSHNRKEKGLHFGGKAGKKSNVHWEQLMSVLKPEWLNFSKTPVRFSYNGGVMGRDVNEW